MDLIQVAAAFPVITGRTGGNNICPDMLPTLMAGFDMIDRQAAILPPTILAGIIVTPEDLPTGQLDPWTGTVDLLLQPDDRGTRQKLGNGVDVAASIHDHVSLA